MANRFNRLPLIGMLVIIAVAMLATVAYARSIAGFALHFSTLTAELDLRGVPNFEKRPSIAIVDLEFASLECCCTNPSENDVRPGEAGTRTVTGTTPLNGDGIIIDKGQAHVPVEFDMSWADQNDENCVNPNWHMIEGSCASDIISATFSWYACTGDPDDPSDEDGPCYDGNDLTIEAIPYDIVDATCTLDPVERNEDCTVVSPQEYVCVEN